MVIYGLHDFVVLAWLLIKLDAKIKKDKLENVFFIFATAVLKFILKLFIFVELTCFVWQEGMANFIIDNGYLFIGVFFF